MTPNFTLSLSFEGIRLLHRNGDAWHVIGEVPVDAADLPQQLAEIRTKAEALEPGPLRTKILLPNEQIRFTAIDSTMTTEEDVNAAIDGATPYPLHELVIDHDRSGGRTHIAAVAKETLDEAEAFAVENGFNPVAFVAAAEPFTFRSEVFFGQTKAAEKLLASGEEVARGEPVRPQAAPATLSPAAPPIVEPAPAEPKVNAVLEETVEVAAKPTAAKVETPKVEEVETPPAPKMEEPEKEPEVLFTRRNREPVLTATREAPPTPPVKAAVPEPAVTAVAAADPVAATPEPAAYVNGTADNEPAPRPVTVEDADAILGRKSRRAAIAAAAPVGGKPRYLGLIMTAGLLIALLLAALWANTLSDDGLAGWYKRTFNVVELQPPSVTPEITVAPTQGVDPVANPDVATTVPSPSLPIVRAPQGHVLSPAEADRIYAATGVYQRAPRLPITPRETTLDDLARARAMPAVPAMAPLLFDGTGAFVADAALSSPSNPPPPGTRYLWDLRGFILAMPDGVVTPEGALLFAGAPAILPPIRPGTEVPVVAPAVAVAEDIDPNSFRLIGGRPAILPPLRPEGLAPEVIVEPEALPVEPVETTPTEIVATEDLIEALQLPTEPDVAQLPGPTPRVDLDEAEPAVDLVIIETAPAILPPARPASFAELTPDDVAAEREAETVVIAFAGSRPIVRPTQLLSDAVIAALTTDTTPPPVEAPESVDVSAVAAAIAAAAPQSNFTSVTNSAVSVSLRPDSRPRNFSQVVARAQAASARQTTSVATVSSAPAAASGPIPGGVARAATLENAIRLRNLNLIGVYGRSNDRRALVRLSNGRYVKVEVGSRLDGGRVTAINATALNYVKNGRTHSLELPSG